MGDEVAVPDRLEEPVGEAERENVLRRFLAEKVIDPKNLFLGEDVVQVGVQRPCAREVGAERLFHHDSGSVDEGRLSKDAYRRQRRIGGHAQVMQPTALAFERLLCLLYCCLDGLSASSERHVVQGPGEGFPVSLGYLAAGKLI